MVVRRAELYTILIFMLLSWIPLDVNGYTGPDYCDGIKSEKNLSFLWGVRRNPPSYFFGTIHVPYTRVWDYIPENAKQAFQESDNVFFELDLLNSKTFEAIHRCQLMPKGQKLSDILPAKLFLRLKRHLEYVQRMIPRWVTTGQLGRGLYDEYLSTTITGNWRRKRPFWLMLMVKSLNEVDIKWHGIPVLDLYLAQRASSMKKDTGGVEDVEEQCVPVNGIGLSQVIYALNQTLTRLERIRYGNSNESTAMDDLVKRYNCRDMSAFIINEDFTVRGKLLQFDEGTYQPKEEYAMKMGEVYLRKELIEKRNRRMGERVSTILKNNPNKSYFFAFGAGHFLGNQTVLDVVEEGGFQIEHIPPDLKLKEKKIISSKELPQISFIQDFSSFKLHDDDSTFSHILNEQKRMNMETTSWIQDNSRQKHQRNFTELWVRLVPNPTGPSMREIHGDIFHDIHGHHGPITEWYGVPSSATVNTPTFPIVITLTVQLSLSIIRSWR